MSCSRLVHLRRWWAALPGRRSRASQPLSVTRSTAVPPRSIAGAGTITGAAIDGPGPSKRALTHTRCLSDARHLCGLCTGQIRRLFRPPGRPFFRFHRKKSLQSLRYDAVHRIQPEPLCSQRQIKSSGRYPVRTFPATGYVACFSKGNR